MSTTQQTFDVRAVLEQMSTEEIPADWRVFLTSRTKLIIALIIAGLSALVPCVFLITLLLVNKHYFLSSGSLPFAIMIGFTFFALVLVAFCILWIWNSTRDNLIILTPEGLITCAGRHKARRMAALSYGEITNIVVTNNTVRLESRGKRVGVGGGLLFDVPADEILFTFWQMYNAFKACEAEETLPHNESAVDNVEPAKEVQTNKTQQALSTKFTSRMFVGIFCFVFVFYNVESMLVARYWPSNLTQWITLLLANTMLFFLTEAVLLLLDLFLRLAMKHIANDPRLSSEEETLESFRLTRWRIRLNYMVFFLECPVFPFVIIFMVGKLFQSSLQILFSHLMQMPYHENNTELLIVGLLSLFCALTIVRLVYIWREHSNTAHTAQEEAQE